MKLRLKVTFNTLGTEFTIKNPALIPSEGDYIRFTWKDFIKDKEARQSISKYEDPGGTYRVKMGAKYFRKNIVTLVVTLIEAEDYEKYKD
jgi:uncharacterized protein YxjI